MTPVSYSNCPVMEPSGPLQISQTVSLKDISETLIFYILLKHWDSHFLISEGYWLSHANSFSPILTASSRQCYQ